MLSKSDKSEKTDQKCDLIAAEKCDSVDVENLDLVMPPSKHNRKWAILNIVFNIALIISVLIWAIWFMTCKPYRLTGLTSTHNIEDEIFKTTMQVVNDTKTILQEIRDRAAAMDHKNKEAALRYVTQIREAMRERTRVGVEKVKRVVDECVAAVEAELRDMKSTTDNVSDQIVNIAKIQMHVIRNTVASAETQNLTHVLEDAIAAAEAEVRSMWYGLDQMYGYYASYWSKLIENKVQNMSERIGGLVNSQRRHCDCTLYERVNMCYNVSLANIDASRTVEKAVKAMGDLYDAADTVDNMRFAYADADQHSLAVIDEAKSLLRTYGRTSRQTLDALLADRHLFLGSAVRTMAQATYPHVKRYILRAWRTSVENATAAYDRVASNYTMIDDGVRGRLVDEVDAFVRDLANEMRTRIAVLADETERRTFDERANFDYLRELGDRFANVTAANNALFSSALTSVGLALKYDTDFAVNQKLPYLSSLSIQNYLPTDVCPLSMNFEQYLTRFLRDSVLKDAPDLLDRLLPTKGVVYADEAMRPDVDGVRTVDDKSAPPIASSISSGIVFYDVDSAADDTQRVSVGTQTDDGTYGAEQESTSNTADADDVKVVSFDDLFENGISAVNDVADGEQNFDHQQSESDADTVIQTIVTDWVVQWDDSGDANADTNVDGEKEDVKIEPTPVLQAALDSERVAGGPDDNKRPETRENESVARKSHSSFKDVAQKVMKMTEAIEGMGGKVDEKQD